eukprot:g103.t1
MSFPKALCVAILSAGAATSMAQPGNSPLGREAAEAESMADRLAPMEKLAYAIERAISKAPHGPANVRNAERELAGEPRRDQEAKKPESELLRAFHLKALAVLQKSQKEALAAMAYGTGPLVDATGPLVDATGPSTFIDATGPLVDAAGPSIDATGPSIDATGPSIDTAWPSIDATGPSIDATGPSIDATGPSIDAVDTGPFVDATGPSYSIDATGPSIDATGPSIDATGPSIDATGHSIDASEPLAGAADVIEPPQIDATGPEVTEPVKKEEDSSNTKEIRVIGSLDKDQEREISELGSLFKKQREELVTSTADLAKTQKEEWEALKAENDELAHMEFKRRINVIAKERAETDKMEESIENDAQAVDHIEDPVKRQAAFGALRVKKQNLKSNLVAKWAKEREELKRQEQLESAEADHKRDKLMVHEKEEQEKLEQRRAEVLKEQKERVKLLTEYQHSVKEKVLAQLAKDRHTAEIKSEQEPKDSKHDWVDMAMECASLYRKVLLAFDAGMDMEEPKRACRQGCRNLVFNCDPPPAATSVESGPEAPATSAGKLDSSMRFQSHILAHVLLDVPAGLESSNLIIGIDLTKSNEWTGKSSFQGRCLHAISRRPNSSNPYEACLGICGRVLAPFDDDNLIPCYGFGCSQTSDHSVLDFSPEGSGGHLHGLDAVLQRYRRLIPHIRLAGPTSFGPLIRRAVDIVAETGGYHILLIVADGNITRGSSQQEGTLSPFEQDTVDAIVEASNYPLSIVMIGVGDGPWDQMREFDDGLPKRRFDNFQFVQYSKVAGSSRDPIAVEAQFALDALMEIPEQYSEIQKLGLLGPGGRHRPNRPAQRIVRPDNPPQADSETRGASDGAVPSLPTAAAVAVPEFPPIAVVTPVTDDSSAGSQHPPLFLCPLSQQLMSDPVQLVDGKTYERANVEFWLASGNRVSPLPPHAPLSTLALFPNIALKKAIDEYKQRL